VILGGGVEADRTAMGMPINLAARMESSAPPGSLRISSEPIVWCAALFEFKEQEPIPIKGREELFNTSWLSEKPHVVFTL